jgi:hypothetical protein
MTRTEQEPTLKPDKGVTSDKTYQHPAFGQIAASRRNGSTTLYGSDFVHQNSITIEISRSELNRGLSRDWHFAREELIEVSLSEAQWATFVSSLNTGGGVPCTLEHVAGETMPRIPLRKEEDEVKEEFSSKVKHLSEIIKASMAEVEGEIGKSLSGVKKERIMGHLEHLLMQVQSNVPFMAKSFGEHMESRVEKAKMEVNAYIETTVSRAGLSALRGENAQPLLSSGEDTNESKN